MGRRAPGKSLNSSMVSNGNNSIVEEADASLEYAEFIKRFGIKQSWTDKSDAELIGYEKTISEVRERFENLSKFEKKNLRHVLLAGPSGTGKSTIVRKMIEEYGAASDDRPKVSFFLLESSWTLEKQFGNPEVRIRSLIDEAVLKQPSLVFIDRIDLICSEKRSQSEDRIFNVLFAELKRLSESSARVLVMATTDRPEILDKRIRKTHSFFRHEIRFPLPSEKDRLTYLKYKLNELEEMQLDEEQIKQIAKRSHCYTYPDLVELCDLAQKLKEGDVVDYAAFEKSLKSLKPAAIEFITTPRQPLRWSDIGGYDLVKKELQESVISRIEHKDKFKMLCGDTEKGALLYGPPGCSKTMLAHALATESGFNFISIKGPEMFSKYVGDSEASVRRLYRNAREIAPCIIFFDEIDGFASERNDNQSSSVNDKVVATLLAELTALGPQENVYTIAATNRPDRVESALLRPGRLNPTIYIPLPSENDRQAIFKNHLPPVSPAVESEIDEVLNKLVANTNGYSGAEIKAVCQTAGKLALRESNYTTEFIEWTHLEQACKIIRPKTRADSIIAYQKFQEMEFEPAIAKQEDNNISSRKESAATTRSSFLDSIAESVKDNQGETDDAVETNNKIDDSSSHLLIQNGEVKSDIVSPTGDNDESIQDKKKKSGTLNRLMRSLSINKKINRAK